MRDKLGETTGEGEGNRKDNEKKRGKETRRQMRVEEKNWYWTEKTGREMIRD
jgi:hypothetical protein